VKLYRRVLRPGQAPASKDADQKMDSEARVWATWQGNNSLPPRLLNPAASHQTHGGPAQNDKRLSD
jgi:hypothetical protein